MVCVFRGNTAPDGGGIRCDFGSDPNIVNCTFISNSAYYDGGGICVMGSSPMLDNCTFAGNSSGEYGGGAFCNTGEAMFNNCIFTGNTSQDLGGGMCCYYSSDRLLSCTFIGNSAESGGGLHSSNSSIETADSLFCGNFLNSFYEPSQIFGSYADNGGNVLSDACPAIYPFPATEGDLNHDGDVDFRDFAVFAENWLAGD